MVKSTAGSRMIEVESASGDYHHRHEDQLKHQKTIESQCSLGRPAIQMDLGAQTPSEDMKTSDNSVPQYSEDVGGEHAVE